MAAKNRAVGDMYFLPKLGKTWVKTKYQVLVIPREEWGPGVLVGRWRDSTLDNPNVYRCCLGHLGKKCGVPDSAMLGLGMPYALAKQFRIISDRLYRKRHRQRRRRLSVRNKRCPENASCRERAANKDAVSCTRHQGPLHRKSEESRGAVGETELKFKPGDRIQPSSGAEKDYILALSPGVRATVVSYCVELSEPKLISIRIDGQSAPKTYAESWWVKEAAPASPASPAGRHRIEDAMRVLLDYLPLSRAPQRAQDAVADLQEILDSL